MKRDSLLLKNGQMICVLGGWRVYGAVSLFQHHLIIHTQNSLLALAFGTQISKQFPHIQTCMIPKGMLHYVPLSLSLFLFPLMMSNSLSHI